MTTSSDESDDLGIDDSRLPEDLRPDDNPLAEGLEPGETAGDAGPGALMEEGKPVDTSEGSEGSEGSEVDAGGAGDDSD